MTTSARERAPADAGPPEEPPLGYRTLADVRRTMGDTEWLWPGWIPRGHLTIIFGPPESGKSFLGLELARCVTTGCAWPDGETNARPPGKVLLLDYEGFEGVTAERAEAAGVPLNLIVLPPEDPIPLSRPTALPQMRAIVGTTQVQLLLIDSWRDACPGVDENDSASTAAAVRPLCLLARDCGLSAVVLHHSRKRQNGLSAEKWVLDQGDLRGSSALAAAGRTIIGIERPGGDTRRLTVVKNSLGPRPEALGFEIGREGLRWTELPMLSQQGPARSKATTFLAEFLADTPRRPNDIIAEAEKRGISERTIYRALRQAAVRQNGLWRLK